MESETKKKIWNLSFLGVAVLWVLMELLAVFDGKEETTPLTILIGENISPFIYVPVIAGFSIWLSKHFINYAIKKWKNKKQLP